MHTKVRGGRGRSRADALLLTLLLAGSATLLGPGIARAALPVVTTPPGEACEVRFESRVITLGGDDVVRLPIAELVTSCAGRPEDRTRLLASDACVYTATAAHLRPEPHDGPRRTLPDGARLASCLPVGGGWSSGGSYPASHRGVARLGTGRVQAVQLAEPLSLAEGVLPSTFTDEFAALEQAWRAHLGGEPPEVPPPELVRGRALPSLLESLAAVPQVERVESAMYQAVDGAWLGWTGPVVIGEAVVGQARCAVVSERGRWRLVDCSTPLQLGTRPLELDLFGVADPNPEAVFGLDGPARGLRADTEQGMPVVRIRDLRVEVAGAAGQGAPEPPPAVVAVIRAPLLDRSRLVGLAAVGAGLLLAGLALLIVARRRGRGRAKEQEAPEEPAKRSPPVGPPPVDDPPDGEELPALSDLPSVTDHPTIFEEPPAPEPPPPAEIVEPEPPPPEPPPPPPPTPPPRPVAHRIGGVPAIAHPVTRYLEDPQVRGAVLTLVGLCHEDSIELLEEAGGFQASFLVGVRDRWREAVVAVYPHVVPAAQRAEHDSRLEALVQTERALWARVDRLVHAQRSRGPERRGPGLAGFPLAVRPSTWRERVKPVRVEASAWSWQGLVRPHIPWPSLADEAQPEEAVEDALGRLVAALVLEPVSRDLVVPVEQLMRELAAGDTGTSGTLRAHQLLVHEDLDGRLVVLPTQWRPLLTEARAAFAWSAP